MTRPFKILSDFDGVWTHVGLEAQVLYEQLADDLTALTGRSRSVVQADVTALRQRVLDEPHRYGWAPDGRISAYADEDPLCETGGLSALISTADDDLATLYRDSILKRWPSLPAFAENGFVTAMGRFRATHPPSIAEDAKQQLEAVKQRGAEVVVVSNSEPGKLIAWFQAAGIDASESPGHELRIRGSAGKQVLGGERSIEVHGRRIYVDRPRYHEAIEQERPHLVIGDIFSLDLALPHVMREDGHPAAPRMLALRRHSHTPAWILDDRAAGAIDHVVDHFGDLAPLIDSTPET
ncbi:MAG: hypothetical protein AAF799_39135 [Myxococcota bacterium]